MDDSDPALLMDLPEDVQFSVAEDNKNKDALYAESLRGCTFKFHTGDVDGRPDCTKEYVFIPSKCKESSATLKNSLLKRWGLEDANLTLFFLAGERHPKSLVTSSLATSVNYKTVMEYARMQVQSKNDLVQKRYNKKKIRADFMQKEEVSGMNLKHPAVKARLFKPEKCEDGFSSDDSDDEVGEDFERMVEDDNDDYEAEGEKDYWSTRASKQVRNNLLDQCTDLNNVESVCSRMLFERLVDMTVTIVESAAKANNWIVVDRTSEHHSPTAELVLEFAMKKTTATPIVLVIDSMMRLKRYSETMSQTDANGEPCSYQPAAQVYEDLLVLNGAAKEANGGYMCRAFDRRSAGTRERDEPFHVLPFPGEGRKEVAPGQPFIYQSMESFDDWREWATKPYPVPPTRKEKLFASEEVHPKCRWSHFYKAGLFGAGSHYIIVEAEGMNFPRNIFGNPGYIFAHGGNKDAETLLSAVYHGSPTILLRNSGGVTQAHASLRAGIRWKKQYCTSYQSVTDDMYITENIANRAITSFLEVFSRDEEWAYGFGTREIDVATECIARSPVLFEDFIVTSNILTATQEEFLSVITTLFSNGGTCGIPELGLGLAEEYLVMNAWFRHIVLYQNAVTYKRTSTFLWLCIALVAFATTVASVMYSNLNKNDQLFATTRLNAQHCDGFSRGTKENASENQAALCLGLWKKLQIFEESSQLTDVLSGFVIMLPILAGFLSTLLSRGAYEDKWRICQIRAAEIVSEIYRFRAKVGLYKNVDASSIASAAKVGVVLQDEREVFKTSIKNIWESVLLSEVGSSGSLKFPREYVASVSSSNKISGAHLDLVRDHIKNNLVTVSLDKTQSKTYLERLLTCFGSFQERRMQQNLMKKREMFKKREEDEERKERERFEIKKEAEKKKKAVSAARRSSSVGTEPQKAWGRVLRPENMQSLRIAGKQKESAFDLLKKVAAGKDDRNTENTAEAHSPGVTAKSEKPKAAVAASRIRESFRNIRIEKKLTPKEQEEIEMEFIAFKKIEAEERERNLGNALMSKAAQLSHDENGKKDRESLYHQCIRDKMGTTKKGGGEEQRDSLTGPISLVQYMHTRAAPLTVHYEVGTPIIDRWLWVFNLIAFSLTSFGALLAVFNLAAWVAITVALAGAVEGWIERSGMRTMRDSMNKNLSDCQNLLTWWDGLTIVEKRTMLSKSKAVDLIESGLIALQVKVTGKPTVAFQGPGVEGEDETVGKDGSAVAISDGGEDEDEETQ